MNNGILFFKLSTLTAFPMHHQMHFSSLLNTTNESKYHDISFLVSEKILKLYLH